MGASDFSSFLSSNLSLDEASIERIINKCATRNVKANEFLLREGETIQTTFYVEKGLLRQYGINEDGKESILQFAPEKWFVTDRESLYFNRPSLYFIQALEDSRVLLINNELMKELSEELPDFEIFNNRLLHNHIHQLTNRIYQLLSHSAEERYLSFIKTYPDIMSRVPQWMVASFLGVTPESLSRVRKNLADRNFNSK